MVSTAELTKAERGWIAGTGSTSFFDGAVIMSSLQTDDYSTLEPTLENSVPLVQLGPRIFSASLGYQQSLS